MKILFSSTRSRSIGTNSKSLISQFFVLTLVLFNLVISNANAATSTQLSIDTPINYDEYSNQESIFFSGTAQDEIDGDISHKIIWRSNIDGRLHKGKSMTKQLSIGIHTITAKVKNSRQEITKKRIKLNILSNSNQLPGIEIDLPYNGATFEYQSVIEFMASASDPEDGNVSNDITWSSNIDGQLGVGSDIAASLSSGNHTITAKVTDSSGASSDRFVNIIVASSPSNSAPYLEIDTPLNGSTFESSANVEFMASASDQEDGNLSNQIIWSSSIDGVLGTGSDITATLTSGIHIIYAFVEDSQGKTTTKETSIQVLSAPQNMPPSVSILTPTSGASFNTENNISFSASAIDHEDGNLNSVIVWSSSIQGNIGIGESISTALAEGNHSITARATDSEGLSNSTQINITIEQAQQNTAPEINIHSPSLGASFESGANISFSASANDAEQGNLSASIVWHSNIDGAIGTGANFSASLSSGSHSITATVSDAQNESSTTQTNIVVLEDANNSQPYVEIDTPSNAQVFDTGTRIEFMGSASDPEDGGISNDIQWRSSIDGLLGIGSDVAAVLSDGEHVISATIYDSKNASHQQKITIQVNQASNTAPVVTILSPANGSVFEGIATVNFTASANDEEDGNISQQVQWHSNIDGHFNSGANVSLALSVGTHTITATSVDSRNASHSQSIIVYINEGTNHQGFATVSWTPPTANTDGSVVENLTGFKVYYGKSANELSQSVSVDGASQVSTYIDGLENNNTYYFAVTAINADGVESDFSNLTSKVISY
ncbi:fibronectin type III domain-containing protein [Aliikangiella sp. IMCC44632]